VKEDHPDKSKNNRIACGVCGESVAHPDETVQVLVVVMAVQSSNRSLNGIHDEEKLGS
jgi:hypothetical protein